MGKPEPLIDEEREAIIVAVQSVFSKLKNLYRDIGPVFERYGFTAPSAGVVARDLSEKIETAIVQHCASFTKGSGHCDLGRLGQDWEVKICKDSGLTINQSKTVGGENYIVVNYSNAIAIKGIWVLWGARDEFFSLRKSNTNARSMLRSLAENNIEVLLAAKRSPKTPSAAQGQLNLMPAASRMAKAVLQKPRKSRAS